LALSCSGRPPDTCIGSTVGGAIGTNPSCAGGTISTGGSDMGGVSNVAGSSVNSSGATAQTGSTVGVAGSGNQSETGGAPRTGGSSAGTGGGNSLPSCASDVRGQTCYMWRTDSGYASNPPGDCSFTITILSNIDGTIHDVAFTCKCNVNFGLSTNPSNCLKGPGCILYISDWMCVANDGLRYGPFG
jgi:hypothetical protein